MVVLALLLVLSQDKVQIIDRLDRHKDLYDKSARACEEAERLLDSDPEAALQKLNDVHEKLDQPDKAGLKEYEKWIGIEVAADELKRRPFFPFQLRGRARLKLGAMAKETEEKRRLLAEAAADLQKSVEKGVKASEKYLREAREEIAKLPAPPPPAPTPEELAAAWSKEWAALRPKLAFATYQPGEATLAGVAGRLFKRMAAEALSRDQLDLVAWFGSEMESAKARVKSLARDEARRTVRWCETLSAAEAGIDVLKASCEALASIRAEAARIADYRGSFTLKIGPAPYGEQVRVLREGAEVPLPAASTPLVLANLEIGDFTVELSHPESGKRTVAISAGSLREGKAYVLSGRMKGGELVVTPLP